MVALLQSDLETLGQRFIVGIQVCAQYRSDRNNVAGDLYADKLKHRGLRLQTLEDNLCQSTWNMQYRTYKY